MSRVQERQTRLLSPMYVGDAHHVTLSNQCFAQLVFVVLIRLCFETDFDGFLASSALEGLL